MTDKVDRGKGTVTLPEMRRGGVGLCVATMIARSAKSSSTSAQAAGPLRNFPSSRRPKQASAREKGKPMTPQTQLELLERLKTLEGMLLMHQLLLRWIRENVEALDPDAKHRIGQLLETATTALRGQLEETTEMRAGGDVAWRKTLKKELK